MGDEQLRGWKEIAGFLQTSERTAQRWEKRHGLPVERIPNDKGAIIGASQDRVRLWQQSAAGSLAVHDQTTADGVHPVEPTTATGRRFLRPWIVWGVCAAVVLIVGGLISALVTGRRGNSVPLASGATASQGPAATTAGPSPSIVKLRVTIGDARTVTDVGIPNRAAAMVSGDAGAGVWLRPTLLAQGLDVTIFRDDGSKTAPGGALVTLRVEKDGRARIDGPVFLQVEWLAEKDAGQRR